MTTTQATLSTQQRDTVGAKLLRFLYAIGQEHAQTAFGSAVRVQPTGARPPMRVAHPHNHIPPVYSK